MIPYDRLIMQALKGDTPKAKYEYLRDMKQLLQKIVFPSNDLYELYKIIDIIVKNKHLVDQFEDYKY